MSVRSINQELSDNLQFVKIKLDIQDNGVGISPDNLKKLFTNFSKLEEHSKSNKTGTGLGLSICKKLVE